MSLVSSNGNNLCCGSPCKAHPGVLVGAPGRQVYG